LRELLSQLLGLLLSEALAVDDDNLRVQVDVLVIDVDDPGRLAGIPLICYA
jgi:hypothetical protein